MPDALLRRLSERLQELRSLAGDDDAAALLPVSHISGNSMMTEDNGPTLLTYSDRSMITIYGDLTRQELIDVANSLTVYGDVNRPLPAGYGD